MVDVKTQTKKQEKAEKEETANVLDEVEEQLKESPVEMETSPTTKPLHDVLGQAEKAYAAYMDAEKQVSMIYRENESQLAAAYRKAEEQATLHCEENIRQAIKVRDEAEQKARATYLQLKEQAEKTCEETIARVLVSRNETISKAWEIHQESMEQAWTIYSRVIR
jgi:hypothetical protein